MTPITTADISANLAELVGRVVRGEEVTITQSGEAVASIVSKASRDDDEFVERPWRGVFPLVTPPDPTIDCPLPPSDSIPFREPQINMSWHRIHDENDDGA